MTDVLSAVLAAHGGEERWRAASTITAQGRVSGLLPKRFAGNRLEDFTFEIQVGDQRAAIRDFPRAGMRAVFDDGDVRIEAEDGAKVSSRSNPRAAFSGLSGVRRNFHWDPLDVAYFAGYASRNYLTSPLLLAQDGVVLRDGGLWKEGGETWRRLDATFPAGFHTHCSQQTFYVDATGLIRRHDFIAEPVGRWAAAALYCFDHREVDGMIFPMRRRVLPRAGRRVLPRPVLLELNFDKIEVA